MLLILKISWRNIFRHKGKSIVIGVILFLGAVIMTLGNGVITGMDRGLNKHIVENFTGNIILISGDQKNEAVIFNFMAESVEIITDYTKVKDFLKAQPYIKKFMPAAFGAPLVLNEDGGEPDFNYVLGVDFTEYRKMFPDNIEILEGRYPDPDERGMLLTDWNRELNFKYLLGYWITPENEELNKANLIPEAGELGDSLKVKDRMIFMGFNEKNTTLDIQAKVIGIIKFKALNKFLGFFNLIDIESFRECFGYFTAEDSASSIGKEANKILKLDDSDLDNLFGTESMFEKTDIQKNAYDISSLKKETEKTKQIDVDQGSYNQVYIKLTSETPLLEGVKKLNQAVKEANLNVRAITWKKGMGEVADMAMIMKGALFIFVMFIFFVAVIIIMNTLSMAAVERIPEIGMMRAVGARKTFISMMFFCETSLLSFAFGGLGIIVGIIAVQILNAMDMTTTNEMLQLFYGGNAFKPYLGIVDILLAMIQLSIVTVLSTIYPILVTRRITPLDAISRD
ncbi:MAG: ABC transporter permease [Proteobacteria bacterium]|nr:ABC transporter permease [Pseudomonadota bacterium]